MGLTALVLSATGLWITSLTLVVALCRAAARVDRLLEGSGCGPDTHEFRLQA